MKTAITCLAAALLFCGCTNKDIKNTQVIEETKTPQITAEVLESDYLKEAQAMNKGTKISTAYRKGHVTERALIQGTKNSKSGYTVSMPGSFPIPTPSYFKGKLYVSGGFGSKTFYCMDAESGKNIWAVNLDDDGPSTAVIEDDVVVFNTESCTLFALDANNGKMLWSWWLGDPLTSAPAIHKGKVYTTYPANGQGNAQLQLQNNTQTATNGEDEIQLPGQNANVKVPAASHIMGCFDLKTGKILWQKWIDGDAMSAPVIENNQVYITTFPGTVYRFACNGGKILAASKARATSAPTIVNNQILYSKRADGQNAKTAMECLSWNNARFEVTYSMNKKEAYYLDHAVQAESVQAAKLHSLDSGNGFSSAPAASGGFKAKSNIGQYRVSGMQSFQGSRALYANKMVYSTMGNELICSNSEKVNWKIPIKGDMKKLGGFMATPPVAAGGEIIIATIEGTIMRIDPDSGKVLKKYETGAPIRFQPIVVDGRIFVGTQNGKVITINTGIKKLTGWPMWGKDACHSGKVD